MDEQPKSVFALPPDLPKKAVAAVTSSTVLYLGLTLLFVVIGSLVLAWHEKPMPDAVIALAGVALGYLGKIFDNRTGASNG